MGVRIITTATVIAGVVLCGAGCGQSDRPALAWGTPAADAEDGRVAPGQTGELSPRRLWAGDFVDFYLTSVSPDGRWITWKDWSTGDLTVHDLESGDIHRITSIARGEGYVEAQTGVFSRDGRRIAYSWAEGATADVRVVDFDGSGSVPRASGPRVIYDNPLKYPYYLWDWSPDGRWVLGQLYGTDNTVSIALFSSTGDTARTLRTVDWREPLNAVFSPDGRFVAYDLPSEADRRVRHVFAVSLDGTRERLVAGGAAHNRLFGWDPDGGILYVAQKSGAPSLWRQPMADGAPAGPPELLRHDLWRAEPIGLAGSTVYYGVKAEVPSLKLVDLDLGAARPANAPLAVPDPTGGDARSMAWSPDGTHLAVTYRDAGRRGRRLAVHAANGDAISELMLDVEPWIGRLTWFPDGRSVMVYGPDDRGRRGFYRVHLGTGARDVVLLAGSDETQGLYALSPDAAVLYFARLATPEQPEGERVMVARTLATGEERRIGVVGWPGLVALSPDGTEIASTIPSADSVSVIVLPVAGGPHRELLHLRGRWLLGSFHWTPDGDHLLLVAQRGTPPFDSHIWLVPTEGGEARKLEGIAADFRNAVLHPNGRRLAYKTGANRGEIWALERAPGTAAVTSTRRSP